METTFFREADFHKFDWSRLRPSVHAASGENYSIGKGGASYIGGPGWHIIIIDYDNNIDECWELPTVMSRIIDWAEKNGASQKERELRIALGIK